jgi:hypothetical protein
MQFILPATGSTITQAISLLFSENTAFTCAKLLYSRTLGKVIGGGLPVGAFGGKKSIMECIAPLGAVYQAGTLSGNPMSIQPRQ